MNLQLNGKTQLIIPFLQALQFRSTTLYYGINTEKSQRFTKKCQKKSQAFQVYGKNSLKNYSIFWVRVFIHCGKNNWLKLTSDEDILKYSECYKLIHFQIYAVLYQESREGAVCR